VAWAERFDPDCVQWTNPTLALATYKVGADGALQLRGGSPPGDCMDCVERGLPKNPASIAVGLLIDRGPSVIFHALMLDAPAQCPACTPDRWRCERCALLVMVTTETAGLWKRVPLYIYLRDNQIIRAVRAHAPGSYVGFEALVEGMCSAFF
jgi:hypothetical protein